MVYFTSLIHPTIISLVRIWSCDEQTRRTSQMEACGRIRRGLLTVHLVGFWRKTRRMPKAGAYLGGPTAPVLAFEYV